MSVANVASSAASSAASGAASSAASQATTSVTSGAAKGASMGSTMPTSTVASPKPATPSGISSSKPNVEGSTNPNHSSLPDIDSENQNSKMNNGTKGDKGVELDQNESNQSDASPSSEESGTEDNSKKNNSEEPDDGKYHARDNQELGPGQKLDEDGNVVDTGNKKFTKALAIGAAAYAGGADGAEAANAISKTEAGDKLTGVVGDKLDKTPVVGKITEDLGESGAADAITDAADTLSAAKSGDVIGAVKSGKSAIKNLGKTVKHYAVLFILGSLVVLGPLIMVCVVIGAVCGPVLGGFMDVTSAFGEFVDDVGDFFTGDNDISGTVGGEALEKIIENADQIVSEVPNYDSLQEPQKSIVTAAAAGIASGRPYTYGGKPTGPGIEGIPTSGIDCSGFVGWSIWTATGKKPEALGTSTMVSNIGTLFEEISESELQPGDIGLKHKNSDSNHTGIYAGNGMWLHAASSSSGLVRSSYKGFTVYLRYKG